MPSLGESRRALLEAVGYAPRMVFVRPFGNFGDEMIWAGTRELLRDRIYREVTVDELAAETGDLAVISGGGAWSLEYSEYMPEALAIAELRFDRVIVFPSTFDTSVPRVREALGRTRATVFAREPVSFTQIHDLCDAHLAHDCAFFSPLPEPIGAGAGELAAFRTDGEGLAELDLPDGNRDISETAESYEDWLATIGRHAVVSTNRAHVMIAAARMGRRVNYASSNYFKVDAIAESCLAEYDVHSLGIRPASGSTPAESDARTTILDGEAAANPTTEYFIRLGRGEALRPGSLAHLVAALDANPGAVAAVPAIATKSDVVLHCGGWPIVAADDVRIEHSDAGRSPGALGRKVESTGWAPATGTLMRTTARDCLPALDLHDPECRAADWAVRMMDRDEAIVRVPAATVETEAPWTRQGSDSLPARAPVIAALESHARFYERHDLILADALADLLPELCDEAGNLDSSRARLLLTVVAARGSTWTLMEWMNGGLAPLLNHPPQVTRRELDWLEDRNAMLEGIEAGGWWQLRERLSPLRRFARRESGSE